MSRALLVIDIQNDYFPGGKYPLWNTEPTLENVVRAIERANATKVPVILVQHLADCCTTVDQMLHTIALHAVSTRLPLTVAADVI